MTLKKLNVAVVGVGYLGKFHAEKYAKIPQANLVAVVDVDQARAKAVAEPLKTNSLTDYTALVGQVDAVSIVVPTQQHFKVAEFFLQQGVHVLIEKPVTVTVEEAQALIDLSKKKKALLQVGHLERFNPVIAAISECLSAPRFIESHRIAPFNLRGSDVNVVLDLMIHDIDLIQSVVNAPIERIDANGAAVISKMPDIANARIQFANGCVANVTASRVSVKAERKMRIFQHDGYFSLDLQNKKMAMYRKGEGELFPGIPNIDIQEKTLDQNDALEDEIKSFVNAVLENKQPIVSGEEGKQSLETAIRITDLIHESGG